MRLFYGILVGLGLAAFVAALAYDPEAFFSFSKHWTTWQTVYASPDKNGRLQPKMLKSRLIFYPLVSCSVETPRGRAEGFDGRMRVNVNVEGKHFLPYLTMSGKMRLESLCLKSFSSRYPDPVMIRHLARQQI